jgi:hypothetical protein
LTGHVAALLAAGKTQRQVDEMVAACKAEEASGLAPCLR